MRYISTRGQAPALSFEEVVLTGMASDGGLYVPETLPEFSKEELADMAGLSYAEIAFRVMKPFVNGEIDDETFRRLVTEAYATFNHDAVVPLKQLDASHFLLEQFHGPTLAFKDVALQLLGRLLDHFLKKRGERAVIMGATSGDTGSAAIEGCRHCDNLDIFILHPLFERERVGKPPRSLSKRWCLPVWPATAASTSRKRCLSSPKKSWPTWPGSPTLRSPFG